MDTNVLPWPDDDRGPPPSWEQPEELELKPLQLLWFATLDLELSADPLVKGLLLAATIFVVYGESNSGKTFWILDLALTIASGQPWCGHRTKRGLVIYVAAEGVASIRARVVAYTKIKGKGAVPFAILPQPVDLMNQAAVTRFVSTVREAEKESGETTVLVIFDTFARSIPTGDENSAQDVGIAVAAADRIRTELGCAVGLIHHAGKDTSKGARGSSALRAAVDTEILIEGQSGTRTATPTKQRDLECASPMAFNLVAIEIARDPEDNTPVTSCTVEHIGNAPTPRRKEPTAKNQQLLLGAIRERVRSTGSNLISSIDLLQIGKAQSLDRKRIAEVRQTLVRDGWIVEATGGVKYISEDAP